jgi:hypothetical protein
MGWKLSPKKSLEKKVEEAAGDIGRGAKKAGETIERKVEEAAGDIGRGAKKIKKRL